MNKHSNNIDECEECECEECECEECECEECECEECGNCNYIINCNRNNIYILTKGDDDLVLCQSCFDDLWKEYSNIGWGGDDIEYYLELEKESESEPIKT